MLLPQARFNFYRQLALECPYCTREELEISLDGRIIAWKVYINCSAGELSIDPTQRAHIVGTHQNVRDSELVFEIFELIQLILLRTPTSSFG